MNEPEAIGEAVTGAALARAVEPDAGEAGADGHTHESACLNCATPLIGAYCHVCGQQAHVHRTLGAFWHDLLHGVLHFEGKIWRTLPLLAWRPGELTRRYIEGERARFVSPIALFLFSVFLMFAAVNLVGGSIFNFDRQASASSEQRLNEELQAARSDAQAEIRELQEQRRELLARGASTQEVDIEIQAVVNALDVQERLLRATLGADAPTPPRPTADAPLIQVGSDGAPFENLGWFNAAYQKAKENPSLLFYKVQSNAYKFSWALIPISVPFVWLLFLHRPRYRRFGAYDHTIFVTYSIAFMSLAWIAFMVLDKAGLHNRVLGVALLIVPPVHMYRQLRGAYALSKWSAAWRTAALLLFAVFAGAIFMALLLLVGVL